MGNHLLVGEVLRSAQNRDPAIAVIDGYPNIHHVTASKHLAQIQLSKGINPIAKVKTPSGQRRPSVLIRSSPWKAGSAETPWHDVFDLDNGHISYFGDHRVDHAVPVGSTQGNALLLEVFAEHGAPTAERRAQAVPLLVFAAVSRNKTPKGYVEFCGVAVIEGLEQIEQEANGRPFPNYRYDLAVLDLSPEDNRLDWAWIEARGNTGLRTDDALAHAPRAWREWVEHGHAALPQVRRQTSHAAPGRATPRHESGGDRELPGLFPASRGSHETASVLPGPAESSQQMTARVLMDRLGNLQVHQNNGRPTRHKPLALLWALARVANGRPRLASWRQFRDEVGGLLAEFGLPESSATPEYPFRHLRTSGLWELHGLPPENSAKAHAVSFHKLNSQAGLTEQAADLLRDPFVGTQAIAVLRETYLADVDQHALMERLGLAGYESASGVPDDIEDLEGESGPAGRRTALLSRIVRNTELAAQVKLLHDDRCQVCGLQLSTRFGTYSQAAHIRGLGRPHHGPDKLSNLLVLCPNHHVQFDALAIYIDADGTVRTTKDDVPIGELRRHPAHRINETHLHYHRALCGRASLTTCY
ncbi:HNH endonuclease [Streptomyces sp. NPDC006446]|uniref:HNH endonuclease n=1 Tax=Streptomyces sp. NPDC006446 TaxID=3154301 RepID=UPI0033A61440